MLQFPQEWLVGKRSWAPSVEILAEIVCLAVGDVVVSAVEAVVAGNVVVVVVVVVEDEAVIVALSVGAVLESAVVSAAGEMSVGVVEYFVEGAVD